MNPRLALGLTLVLLAWWCGPQGYGDLREYAVISDQLWSHGTFALPDGTQSRFCWGFPFLLLPLRALGAILEALWQQDNLAHWLTSLLPPLATVLAACFIERFARRTGATPVDGVFAALLVVLAAPTLYFSRMLNLEPVIGALLIASVVLAEESRTWRLAGVAGTCLGAAFACHYANGPGIAVLAVGLAWRLQQRCGWRVGWSLGLSALAWAVATAAINHARYGAYLTSGYNSYEKVALSAGDFLANVPHVGFVLALVPWIAVVLLGVFRSGGHGDGQVARRGGSWLSLPRLIALAIVVQVTIWMCTWQFSVYSVRYLVAWVMFAGLLLPGTFSALRRWSWSDAAIQRGVSAVVLWSFLGFLGLDEFCRPMTYDRTHPVFPGQLLMATWYQPRAPYRETQPYLWNLSTAEYGDMLYPERPVTWWTGLFGILLCGGGLALAFSAAKPVTTSTDEPGGNCDPLTPPG